MMYQVADIKKINGLVTDLQMFARKTLFIPLPGRYPPSPNMANGFDSPGYCYARHSLFYIIFFFSSVEKSKLGSTT